MSPGLRDMRREASPGRRWARASAGWLAVAALALSVAVRAETPAAAATRELLPEDLPPATATRVNPVAGDAAAAARGGALFLDNCAPCHGEAGDGRGPASVGLKPPPADLAGGDVVSRHSDAYLFHRLSIGKRGSAMPAFGHALSEGERWEIVAYLRQLAGHGQRAPGLAAKAPGGR